MGEFFGAGTGIFGGLFSAGVSFFGGELRLVAQFNGLVLDQCAGFFASLGAKAKRRRRRETIDYKTTENPPSRSDMAFLL
jgi:hypothetical protein